MVMRLTKIFGGTSLGHHMVRLGNMVPDRCTARISKDVILGAVEQHRGRIAEGQ